MIGSKIGWKNLGVGAGWRGNVQWLLGKCAKVAGEMCKGCPENMQRLPGKCAKVAGEMRKGCRGNVLTCENKVN